LSPRLSGQKNLPPRPPKKPWIVSVAFFAFPLKENFLYSKMNPSAPFCFTPEPGIWQGAVIFFLWVYLLANPTDKAWCGI